VTAALSRDTGVHFGLVELDLLAAHAGVRFPFPLRVPEFGRIAGEREALLAAAGATLRVRGLAGERGPVGLAAEVVTALREHRGTVDLVLAGPDTAVGVVALVYRSWALICGQPLTGSPTDLVGVRRVAQTALADELFELVPEREPAQAMPITVPPSGADSDLVDQLAVLLPEVTGRGQLGATRSRAGRAGPELSWVDSPNGRVRVNRTADGWLSVNPLRHNDIRYTLDDLTTIARGERNGR
jgi:hypothetical protein